MSFNLPYYAKYSKKKIPEKKVQALTKLLQERFDQGLHSLTISQDVLDIRASANIRISRERSRVRTVCVVTTNSINPVSILYKSYFL